MSATRRARIDGGRLALLCLGGAAFVLVGLSDPGAAWAAAHEAPSLLALAVFVSRFGLSGYMLCLSAAVAGGAILVLRRTGRPDIAARARRIAERAVFVFAAIAVSGLACQTLKHLVGRARPRFLETLGAYHFDGPSLRSGFESFPSGHSTTAFAAALALSMLKPAWSTVLVPAAALICVSRILAQAHYPSDTLAGALLGTLVTLWVGKTFAARDIAFTASDRPHRPAIGRMFEPALERDARAL